MADNTAITPGTGETIRDKDRAGIKTQIMGLDVNISGTESLGTGTVAGTKNTLDVNIAASAGGVAIVTQAVSTTALASATGTASTTAMVVAPVSNSGNATIALYGGTYTALTIVFEACIDAAGTNWFPVDAARADGTAIELQAVFTATGVRAWNIIAPGYTYIRARVAAITQTVAPTLQISQGPFLYEPSPAIAPLDGQKFTYCAYVNALASNLASDFWWLKGSATRTVRLIRLDVGVTVTGTITAGGNVLSLVKRTTLDTVGTAGTVPAIGANDSGDPAATAVAGTYTAAPTLGTLAATIRSARFAMAATTLTWSWDFGNRPSKAPVLRSATEQVALNLAAAFAGTTPATAWTINAEFTEE